MYDRIVILGVIVSMVFTELTGFSAGLILPGYFALQLGSPLKAASTLAVSLCAVLICRLVSRYLILFGRRRFAFLILVSFFLTLAAGKAGLLPFGVIGILVPGILAREMDRQGIGMTLLSLAVTTLLTALLVIAAGSSLPGI